MDMVVYGYGIVNGVHEVLMDKEMWLPVIGTKEAASDSNHTQ